MTDLERIPQSPPEIAPLPDGVEQPLFSVMIPTYNCYKYIETAVQSVLQQDMGAQKMQIEVIDDFSTDGDVEALVKKIGNGRVQFFRQQKNMGSLRNFETCINRASGQWVHILHGDDCVADGYYDEIEMLFNKFPEAGAAFTNLEYIHDDGSHMVFFKKEADEPTLITDMLYRLSERIRMQYACVTVKRNVYEDVGSFFGVTYGEDWEMWARISKKYSFAYSPRPLAKYREHTENSISSSGFKTGKNFRDNMWVIDQISSYLPKEIQAERNLVAKKQYLHWAIGAVYRIWTQDRDTAAFNKQIESIRNIYTDADIEKRIKSMQLRMKLQPVKSLINKTLGRK